MFPLQIGMKYEAILACEGLVINGTGHQLLRVKKVRPIILCTSVDVS